MRAAIRRIFRSNLAIKDGERILLVTDDGKHAMAEQFLEVAEELGHAAELATVPIPEVHGVEPPAAVARKMLAADVIFIITTKSLSHTLARANATERGARIATMAGVTEDILRRFSRVDLRQMKARTNMFADILDRGRQVLLTSKKGTSLAFSIAERIAHGRKASIFDRPGYWGNIPCGEAFIAPIEDSVNGTLVIDASIAGIGLVDRNATFRIENGKVVDVEGGSAARRFEALLDDSEQAPGCRVRNRHERQGRDHGHHDRGREGARHLPRRVWQQQVLRRYEPGRLSHGLRDESPHHRRGWAHHHGRMSLRSTGPSPPGSSPAPGASPWTACRFPRPRSGSRSTP